jgi:hypothetical protein
MFQNNIQMYGCFIHTASAHVLNTIVIELSEFTTLSIVLPLLKTLHIGWILAPFIVTPETETNFFCWACLGST